MPGGYMVDTAGGRIILTGMPCPVKPLVVKNTFNGTKFDIPDPAVGFIIPYPMSILGEFSDPLEITVEVKESDMESYINWRK